MHIRNYQFYDRGKLERDTDNDGYHLHQNTPLKKEDLAIDLPYLNYVFEDGKTFAEKFIVKGYDNYGAHVATGFIEWENAKAEIEALAQSCPQHEIRVCIYEPPAATYMPCPEITSEEWIGLHNNRYFGDMEMWRIYKGKTFVDNERLEASQILNTLKHEDEARRPNKIAAYYLPSFKTQHVYSYTDDFVYYTTSKKPDPPSKMSLGKFVQKSLSVMYSNLTEQVLQQVISSLATAIIDSVTELSIGSSYDDFERAYSDSSCSSCMTEHAEDTADFYAFQIARTEKTYVEIATLTNRNDDIVARCLIWTDRGRKVIDRRYGEDDPCRSLREQLEEMFPDAAVRTGKCTDAFSFKGEGKLIAEQMSFPVDLDNGCPYLDTFAGTSEVDGATRLVLGHDLKSTDGFVLLYCAHCGERFHPDDDNGFSINDEDFCCGDCAEAEGWRECHRCCEWVHEDSSDIVFVEGKDDICYCCEHCAERDGCKKCDYQECYEWYDADRGGITVYDFLDGEQGTYCCAEHAEADGAVMCPHCQTWRPKKQTFEVNGKFYCSPEHAANAGENF